MRTRASLLVPTVAMILGGVTISAPSFGQSPNKGPSPAKRAKQLYDQGNALYDREKVKEAEQAYQAAWDLHQSASIAAKLGHVELILGQDCEAVEHLQFAYDNVPPGGKPEEKERLFGLFMKARRRKAYLEINVDVTGADVRVDGKVVGISPLARELCVDQGAWVVEVTRPGYVGESQKPYAIHGLTTVVDLHLVPRSWSFVEAKSTSVMAVGGALAAIIGIRSAVDADTQSSWNREPQGQLVEGQYNDAQPRWFEPDETLESLDWLATLVAAGFVGVDVAAMVTGTSPLWPAPAPPPATPRSSPTPVVSDPSTDGVVDGHF